MFWLHTAPAADNKFEVYVGRELQTQTLGKLHIIGCSKRSVGNPNHMVSFMFDVGSKVKNQLKT